MSFKVKDFYFKKAKKENYVARSVYKLKEIDDKYNILSKNQAILDLGYYPGSWLQYVVEKIGVKGQAVGIDIKEVNTKFNSDANVWLFQKDIFEITQLHEISREEAFDAVISDMAPNTTGMANVDQLRSLNLVEHVFHILPLFLKDGGDFVMKIFESHEAQMFLKEQKKNFKSMHYLKPKSTRSISKEFFVIGKGYKSKQV